MFDLGVERDAERDKITPLGLTEERHATLYTAIRLRSSAKPTPSEFAYVLAEICDSPAEALLMAISVLL